jgi:hypothetical protein
MTTFKVLVSLEIKIFNLSSIISCAETVTPSLSVPNKVVSSFLN